MYIRKRRVSEEIGKENGKKNRRWKKKERKRKKKMCLVRPKNILKEKGRGESSKRLKKRKVMIGWRRRKNRKRGPSEDGFLRIKIFKEWISKEERRIKKIRMHMRNFSKMKKLELGERKINVN